MSLLDKTYFLMYCIRIGPVENEHDQVTLFYVRWLQVKLENYTHLQHHAYPALLQARDYPSKLLDTKFKFLTEQNSIDSQTLYIYYCHLNFTVNRGGSVNIRGCNNINFSFVLTIVITYFIVKLLIEKLTRWLFMAQLREAP